MISLNAQITKEIENNFRKFGFLSKPVRRNLKELQKGMILKQSCYLSEIGRLQSPEENERKTIERYSNALEKADHEGMIRAMIKSKKRYFNTPGVSGYSVTGFPKNPNLILVDGGEIAKPHSNREARETEGQRMEYCCGIADGSNHHRPNWGYKMMNISLHTPHNSRTHILSQHLFSSNAPGYNSDWDEQKTKLELVKDLIQPENSILVEDSIGDDEKRIRYYLNDQKVHLITRGQNQRKYDADFEGDKLRMTFKEIGQQLQAEGRFDTENTRTYFDKKMKQKVRSQVAYLPVTHPDLKTHQGELHSLFLVLVKSEAYDEPMAILTDIEPICTEEAWQIFFWYKKRWEVEKIYRDIKQKFKLESALIRNYQAWKTLVVLTALSWEFLQKITQEVKAFLGSLYSLFEAWLQKKQRSKTSHLNLLDWIREFLAPYQSPFSHRFYSWKSFLSRFSKPKNQLPLFDWRSKIVNC